MKEIRQFAVVALRSFLRITVVVGLCAASAPAMAADPGCLDTDPLPQGPALGTETLSFNASHRGPDMMRIEMWRVSCAPNASRLYIRTTPTLGVPYVCGTDFSVVQGNRTYDIGLGRDNTGGTQNTYCGNLDALDVPTTFRVVQYASLRFDPELALRLVFRGVLQSYQGELAAAGTAPLTPVVGLWWNPDESGSGYFLDVKHGVLVATIFSYRANGEPEWYYVSGPLTNGGRSFTGTLDKYRGGQCISCPYAGRPTAAGNDGAVTIHFSSPTAATLTLPGGRVTSIRPQEF